MAFPVGYRWQEWWEKVLVYFPGRKVEQKESFLVIYRRRLWSLVFDFINGNNIAIKGRRQLSDSIHSCWVTPLKSFFFMTWKENDRLYLELVPAKLFKQHSSWWTDKWNWWKVVTFQTYCVYIIKLEHLPEEISNFETKKRHAPSYKNSLYQHTLSNWQRIFFLFPPFPIK